MKYSLCIEPIFTDITVYDRIALAKDCGVDAIELWNPVNYDAKKIGKALSSCNMTIAACCLSDAWKYRLNAPYEVVQRNVERTISLGEDMGCTTFIGMTGDVECKVDRQRVILIENLKRISDFCLKKGVTILLEPLNTIYDHKGFYLDSSYVGFEIVKCVNSPAIKLLYDCYHMQIMEGNLINNITANIDFIGHFHCAGVPGRHEPHHGEINYPIVIGEILNTGYSGYFGLEYWPTYDNLQSVRDALNSFQTKT